MLAVRCYIKYCDDKDDDLPNEKYLFKRVTNEQFKEAIKHCDYKSYDRKDIGHCLDEYRNQFHPAVTA